MAGKLYLCATPIGNLEDITYRVVRTLKEVDLIAAEDTRNSIKLLNHFEIRTPMTSYHEYNKIEKAYQLVDKMREGLNIALITDAGTPGISDPGEDLVRICYEEGIEVTSLPGPAACITALTMSGQPTRRFAFEAFLPREKKERAAVLSQLVNETRTIIIYEAPHHLIRTLEELYENMELMQAIWRSVASLSPVQRRRVLRHFVDGYTYAEIAAMEGRNKTTVMRSTKAALKKIKKFLPHNGNFWPISLLI